MKADKEFVTNTLEDISAEHKLKQQIVIRMPPPGDHRRVIGGVEGGNRWKQQTAQASLNRLDPLVKQGIVTERNEPASGSWLLSSHTSYPM